MNQLQELIKIREQIAALEAQEQAIKLDIIIDPAYEDTVIDGHKITKVTVNTTVLKEGIDPEDVMARFPDAVRQSLDVKVLDANPAAHDFLTVRQSAQVRVTKLK